MPFNLKRWHIYYTLLNNVNKFYFNDELKKIKIFDLINTYQENVSRITVTLDF